MDFQLNLNKTKIYVTKTKKIQDKLYLFLKILKKC